MYVLVFTFKYIVFIVLDNVNSSESFNSFFYFREFLMSHYTAHAYCPYYPAECPKKEVGNEFKWAFFHYYARFLRMFLINVKTYMGSLIAIKLA